MFGNPQDGNVRGSQDSTSEYVKWKVTEVPGTSPVQITLENVGLPSSSLKWLNGWTHNGTVSLHENKDKWEIQEMVLREMAIFRNGDPGIWFIKNNCRHLFDPTEYKTWKARGGIAIQVEQIIIDSLPHCPVTAVPVLTVVIPPDGTYISNSGGIWKMENGKKRLFPNWCTFKEMGGAKSVTPIMDFDFQRIPDGDNYPPIPCKITPPAPIPLVCPNGPGIIVTILATDGNIENYVQATNSETKKQSDKVYMQQPGGVFGMREAFQRAAKSVGIVIQIIPNSQAIRVCGRDHIFTVVRTDVSTKQF